MPIAATNNFLVPNIATFVFELVSFLIVLAILAKFVLPKLNAAMNQRQATIQQALTDAEAARRRAKETEEEYRRTMEQARIEARSLVDEAKRLGEQMRADLLQRGEEEHQRIVARAQSEIEASVRRATEEVRQQTADLVIAVVERVVGEVLDSEAQHRLVERTIADVERQASLSGEPAAADVVGS